MNMVGAGVAAVAFLTLAACGNTGDGLIRTGVLAGQTMDGQPIPCATQEEGLRICVGEFSVEDGTDLRFETFDGVPLAVWVTLPAAPASGADGGYPLVVQSHGWGAPPSGPNDTQYGGPTAVQWAQDGYAVLQFAARGWGSSCGTAESRSVNPSACATGYIRLDDARYEIRDVQHAVGLLVDEGIADPDRIGAMGESYGAGTSLELATLNDRVMNTDGSLSPWTSPNGTRLHISAAAPFAGYSDLAYALWPNGWTFDSQVTSPLIGFSVPGISKSSIVNGLYAVGLLYGYYAPAGSDPQADPTTWFANVNAGEPYYDTPADQSMVEMMTQFRSPYHLLAGAYGAERKAPSPLLMANGFTDDVFPADEVLRYYNLVKSLYPAHPIELLFFDGGHQRGQNKLVDAQAIGLPARIHAFFDHYVKGGGPQPPLDVTALTQTCPSSAPSAGPYTAATWTALHPGEVRYTSAAAQTIRSDGGDPAVSRAFEPIAGGLACTTASAADEGPGVATYRLPTPSGPGYTLLGAPEVTADLNVTGEFAYIAARLVDVDVGTNTKTLVARGVYRIDTNAPNGRQTFQLHANGWHFAPGHIPQLELLGRESPYLRASNGQFSIEVSNLSLNLPVHEAPGAPGTPPEVTSSASAR